MSGGNDPERTPWPPANRPAPRVPTPTCAKVEQERPTTCAGWSGSGRLSDGQAASKVERDLAVGAHVLPEQRAEPPPVGQGQQGGPFGFGQDLLKHEGVDEDEGGLQDPQAQRGHLDLLFVVGGDLPALAVADDRVGPVPGFHHVQALLDLPLQVPVEKVARHYMESSIVKSRRSAARI